MIVAVADTHAIIWFLAGDSRLSLRARQFMEQATQNGHQIAVSSITLIEIVYLVEKGRIPAQRFTQLANALGEPDSMFSQVPVDLSVARSMTAVDVMQIPDMPDRIVAATAYWLRVPIISRDGRIRLSNLQTIW
ncbi:MAG: PIN domain protein [Chloroflexi bacterium]|nr:PIN domain protein [Chloroflexota bacterium]